MSDARSFLGIQGLQRVRLWNRYDAEGIDRSLFDQAVRTVFSEPQLDIASTQEAVEAKRRALRSSRWNTSRPV